MGGPRRGGAGQPALLLALCASLALLPAVVDAQITCSRIPFCTGCAMRRVGSLTRLVCTSCQAGYAVSTDQRTCWCAPGFFWNATTCEPCGIGAWCSGGSSATRGPRVACGSNMTTTTGRARAATQCVPKPGNGLLADSANAGLCGVGYYSYGFARKPCVSCPRTFTTAGPGADSRWKCATPPGYRYSDEQAVPCGFGFWKAGVDFSAACTPCGLGLTTATATSTKASDCGLAKPGYRLVKSGSTVTGVVACGDGTWSAGGDVTSCTSCPAGTTTVCRVCNSASNCIADAGYGYNATSGAIAACPANTYKSSLGSFPCMSCGDGLLTDGVASTGYNSCYIPVGWGATIVSYSIGLLEATRCTGGTYGMAAPAFGPRSGDYACQKCPLHMTTQDTNPALSSADQAAVVNNGSSSCVTQPGYGWDGSSATACSAGTFSPGYVRAACSACPNGTTSSPGASSCA